MNLDLTEVPSQHEETYHWYFQHLTFGGLLQDEADDLARKVANGIVARPVDHVDLMKDFELAKVSEKEESLVIKIRRMFSSLDSLSINFLPTDCSTGVVAGLDMALLKKFYNSAKELNSKEVTSAIMESTESLLSLDEGSWTSANSIILRIIITLLERLWKLILNQPAHFKANLLLALQSYDRDQLERLLATVQQFITILVYESPINDKVEAGLQILEFLYRANEKSQVVDHMFFYNDAVNSEDFNIVADFKIWMERSLFSFCNYPFVYDTSSKSKILQLDSNIQMRNEFQDAIFRSIFLEGTCPYLVLRVRRENLIRETILQIRGHTEDLKKPLKVQFIGEDGIDEGGVQKEFFQLLVRDIFDPKYGMFAYNDETRLFWFNSPPWDVLEEFELVGIVLGLAIYNGHILELHFPKVVYKKLLGKVPTIEDLSELDPGLAKGLKQLLQFDGDIEETFCRSFQVSVSDIFGEVRNIELKENGGDISVTKENRKEYVDLCVKYYLETSIELSFEAFRKGFQKLWRGRVLQFEKFDQTSKGYYNLLEHLSRGADGGKCTGADENQMGSGDIDKSANPGGEEMSKTSLSGLKILSLSSNKDMLFHPAELEQLICGSPVLDFEALEKYTIYEDGYRKDSRIVREFWEIVHSLDKENKKKLLFFATGSDRAPIKGLANLRFVISKNDESKPGVALVYQAYPPVSDYLIDNENSGSDSERLPTAHTCFNHLLLPEYQNKEKLKERLLTAINNSQGFGLM